MHNDIFTTETRNAVCKAVPLFEGAHILKLLHRIHQPEIDRIRERRENVLHLIDLIAFHAQDGKVCAVESGRDCDGVEYSGKIHTIDATIKAWRDLDDDIGQWADGPYYLSVASLREAETIEYASRDLVMEAHEDGHRHVIYSQYP